MACLPVMLAAAPTTGVEPSDATASKKPPKRLAAKATATGEVAADPSEPTIPSLEDMLKVALENNPDVRAAEARLHVAEAELDHTRLGVVQKVIAFRENWQVERAALVTREDEVRMAKQNRDRGFSTTAQVRVAELTLARARAKLVEMEAEMPFLLGRAPDRPVAESDPAREKKLALLMAARKTFELVTEAHRTGTSDADRAYLWSRRWMEAERHLATSRTEHVAAVEAHVARVNALVATTKALYEAGETALDRVIAAQFYLAEAELSLIEARQK
jgi:hypothetical protein